MRFISEVEACGELASAVILKACEDYFICKRKLAKGKNTANGFSNCQKLLDECIEFFKSDQYKLYSNGNEGLDGERVMRHIDSMVDDYVNYPNDVSPFKYRVEEEEEEQE